MSKITEAFFTFIQNYSEAAIFFALLLEQVALPIPGELLILMLGFSGDDIGAAVSYMIFAAASSFAGSMSAYAIGRRYGEKTLLKFVSKEKSKLLNERMKKRQIPYMIFSRFIPGVRHIVPYLSGTASVNVYRHVLCNLIGSAVWCFAFVFAGYLAGSGWTEAGRLSGILTA